MNQVGVKLTCATCNAQVIVIKGGSGAVTCHGMRMQPPISRPEAPR